MNRPEIRPTGQLAVNERLLLKEMDSVLFVEESRMIARAKQILSAAPARTFVCSAHMYSNCLVPSCVAERESVSS